MQNCPWCDFKFGFFSFNSHFRANLGFHELRISDSPNKIFPCPSCGKSIERKTDVETTKSAARKLAWIFLLPFIIWFFMSGIYHATVSTTAFVVLMSFVLCFILFEMITDYKGQVLMKSGK